MSKKYSIFITALFCLFLFGFGIFQFILPDRDFSEQENRYLAQFKAPTLKTIRSGEFMEDFEDYVTDQFPLRDQWIQLKALLDRPLHRPLPGGADTAGGLREQAGGKPGRAGVFLFGAG